MGFFMLIKNKDQRVAVLIDAQNLYHSARNIYSAKVNFEAVLKTAVAGRKLIRAISYAIQTESEEEKPFFEALKRIGIEVKIKDLQVFPGGMKKGNWDVGIAVDAIKFSQRLDALVLVTGDGDFVPLLEYIKNATPVRIEIVAFGKSCSSQLRLTSHDFIDLGQNPGKYLLK